jgi:hypothetical protein
VRTQSRIKAELRFYGIHLEESMGKWTQIYFANLRRIDFGNRWMQESFNRLLEQYEFLSAQIDKQTKLLRELSETELYQERVKILQSIPGVGIISAMELLLELQDVSRFRCPFGPSPKVAVPGLITADSQGICSKRGWYAKKFRGNYFFSEICAIMPSKRHFRHKRGNLSGLNSVREVLKTIF